MSQPSLPSRLVLPVLQPAPSLVILSDTHGLLRPAVLDALRGVDHIFHLGDLGSEAVLQKLQALAPVSAVRGNVDAGAWADQLPLRASLNLGGIQFYLIHDIADLARYPEPRGTQILLYGHSHKPAVSTLNGIIRLNPGSVGPRRFTLPVSLVSAQMTEEGWQFSFLDLTAKV